MNARLITRNLFFAINLLAILLTACSAAPSTSAPIAVQPVAATEAPVRTKRKRQRPTVTSPNCARSFRSRSGRKKRPDCTTAHVTSLFPASAIADRGHPGQRSFDLDPAHAGSPG